ncbi:hypothetical protein BSKO_05680 [Bryopsis sp. KO-2023]|nr:hypothetical protein BSKO_05680 [Bryopsis sp. KO-2023]
MIALIYLDDFLFQFHSLQDARLGSRLLRNIFRLMGLLEHPTKSDWKPSQLREHLGLTIDSDTNTLSLPPSKISKLRAVASEILQRCSRSSRWISKRRMASFCGLVESTSIVVPEARMHIAKCYDCMTQTPGWNGRIKISHGALKDVRYFIALCKRMTSVPINLPTQQLLLQTDASPTGWGAVLRRDMNPSTKVIPVQGFWTQKERAFHINRKEMRAVRFALQAFQPLLTPDAQLRIHIDNRVLIDIIRKASSRSVDLREEFAQLLAQTLRMHIWLKPIYIPSRINLLADALSRQCDKGDWRLCPTIFRQLQEKWGPLQVDRFADKDNTFLPLYNTRDHDPHSMGTDALQQDWRLWRNYAHPPWGLILPVLDLLLHQRPFCVIILPVWTAAPWYAHMIRISARRWLLPNLPNLFSKGPRVPSEFDAFWSALFEGTDTPPWLAFVTGPLLHGVDNLLEHLRSTWLAWVQSSRDAMRIRIRKYFVFCASYKELPFPSRPAKLYAYIKWLQKEGDISYKTAPQYVAALSSVQRWLGHEKYSVFDGQSKLLLAAWRNLQVDTDSVDEVTIFTTSLLFQVVDLGIRTADTALLRSATAVVVAYIFFGRSSSHTWVRGNDLLVDLQGTSISFREREFKAKRRRSGVYRLRTFKISTCPSVGNLVRRFLATKRQCYETASEFETQLLFRLPGEAATLTRATFAAWFHSVLAELSLPPTLSQLTPHSLRRGSVTEAFAIGVVTEKLCHWGGWSGSSNTIWKYIDRSFLPSAEGLLLFQWMLGTQTQGLVSISDLVLGLPPATRQKLE